MNLPKKRPLRVDGLEYERKEGENSGRRVRPKGAEGKKGNKVSGNNNAHKRPDRSKGKERKLLKRGGGRKKTPKEERADAL